MLLRRHYLVAIVMLVLLAATAQAEQAAASPETVNVCSGTPPSGNAPSAGDIAGTPLNVNDASHVVVMEYEAWFGRRTGVAPQSNVTTCLQSTDMQQLGGGYDSADPAAIAQHIKWLEQMGIDAVTLDLTNNVSCIFDGDNRNIIDHVCPNHQFRHRQLAIRDNVGNLYPAWNGFKEKPGGGRPAGRLLEGNSNGRGGNPSQLESMLPQGERQICLILLTLQGIPTRGSKKNSPRRMERGRGRPRSCRGVF